MSDRNRGWALVGGQFALLGALVVVPTGSSWDVPTWIRTVGAVGRILGVVAIGYGAFRLGPSLSVHPEPTDQATLRTTGPYRWVRHPIYTGVLVLGAAIAATAGTVAHPILFVALLGLLTAKARFEERLLADRFPSYSAYAARTGRFLPRPGAPT